jgi:hypothetical protein
MGRLLRVHDRLQPGQRHQWRRRLARRPAAELPRRALALWREGAAQGNSKIGNNPTGKRRSRVKQRRARASGLHPCPRGSHSRRLRARGPHLGLRWQCAPGPRPRLQRPCAHGAAAGGTADPEEEGRGMQAWEGRRRGEAAASGQPRERKKNQSDTM